jgi:hypothetical protein
MDARRRPCRPGRRRGATGPGAGLSRSVGLNSGTSPEHSWSPTDIVVGQVPG